MKINLFFVAFSTIILSLIASVFLPLMPDNVQKGLELLTGYFVLYAFVQIAILNYIEASKVGSTFMKIFSTITYSIYSLMYFAYLTFDYGTKQPHTSAIGFSFATISLTLLQYYSYIEKRKIKEKENELVKK